MEPTFNPHKYIEHLGKELVSSFTGAGLGTHPGGIGSQREQAVCKKLENILHRGIGVGSGFIIDSFGNTSPQCDIILYEKDLALILPTEDSRYAYYNCESVIAIGEVKSDASIHDVADAFNKIKKIRQLKRSPVVPREFRPYLTKITISGTIEEEFDSINKASDQIMSFIVCKSLKTNFNSIYNKANDIFVRRSE